MDSDEDDEEKDDEEKEDEESVVSDDKVSEVEAKEGEGSGGSVTFGQSDGESSGGCSGKSNLEEEDVKCLDAAEEDKGCKQSYAGLDDSVKAEKKIVEFVEESVVVSSVETQELKPVAERVDECESVTKEIVEQSVDVPGLEEPLNLENFNLAAELEVNGYGLFSQICIYFLFTLDA